MPDKVDFSNNGSTYHVDNAAYMDGKTCGVFFEVKQCSNCKKINSYHSSVCKKCNTILKDNTVCIASRHHRTVLGFFIGSLIISLITVSLGMFANIRLGTIPMFILVGAGLTFGELLAGDKIVIDADATKAFRQYRSKDQKNDSQDNASSSPYALVKLCPYCNQRTENDSIYCSNCGKRLNS